MNIRHMIVREISFRFGSFLLAVLSVLVAVGCLVAELSILHLHDETTERIVAKKEADTKQRMDKLETDTKKRMAKLQDDYRKITKKMGFNILILPAKQDMNKLYVQGYANATMPEKYVKDLAASKIMTIRHLLPIVQQMTRWDEHKRTVLLTGIRGEETLLHRDPKKPLLPQVPKDTLVIGYELATGLDLKKGDKVQFQGRNFSIHKVQPERGTKDDITVWMDLGQAQKITNTEGKLNVIMALECNCASIDRLGEIRKEVQKVLPDTKVIELQGQALARAEARNRAKKEAMDSKKRIADEAAAALKSEKDSRDQMRSQLTMVGSLLIPLALLGAIVWLAVLSINNVREREAEIGILRALGLSSSNVYVLFISRAVLVGVVGAVLGYLLGSCVGLAWAEMDVSLFSDSWNYSLILLVSTLVAAPLICAGIGWMAASLANQQDPAAILQNS